MLRLPGVSYSFNGLLSAIKVLACVSLTVLLNAPSGHAQSAYSNAVISLNPVAYWPMHEVEPAASGPIETNRGALGSVANAYFGAWETNGGITNQIPGALANDPDTAMGFGGANPDYLLVPLTSPQVSMKPPFTVECWANAYGPTTIGEIVGQRGEKLNGGSGAANDNGWGVDWGETSDGYEIEVESNGSAVATLEGGPAAANTWYYLVATCDANTNWTLYTNGVALAINSEHVPFIGSASIPLTLGGGFWEGSAGCFRPFHGGVQDVALYTNVLSQSRIVAHYNAGLNPATYGAYETNVLADGPLLYYQMDAPAYIPPAADTLPVLNNYGSAAVNGVYTPGSMPGAAMGPFNLDGLPFGGLSASNALPANGLSSFADAGYSPVFNVTSGIPFTVTAMFQGNPTDSRIQSIVGHGSNSWQIVLNASGHIECNSGNGAVTAAATNDLTSPTEYNDGNWHQLVFTYNGTNTESLYVDGVLDTSETSAAYTNGVGSTEDVLIGADPSFTNNPAGIGRQFAGQICEVALFTNALTPGQIETLYNSASGVAPYITEQPANGGEIVGGTGASFSFTVAANGSSPLACQWYFNTSSNYNGATDLANNANFLNATTAELTVTNLTANDDGYYFVIVTNNYGSVTSVLASLTVSTVIGIVITTNPVSQFAVAGGTAVFTVGAVGAPPLSYQWQENGTNLTNGIASSGTIFSGVNSAMLTLQNISYADSGAVFDCQVTNEAGAMTVSSGATLTAADPVLVSTPQAETVSPGGTASFSVTAAGSGPFTYQWDDDGIPLMDGLSPSGAIISGAMTASLQIAGVAYGDAGNYSVTVNNAYNASAASLPVALTVVYTNATTPMDYISVKAYGAKGDGVTDDTLAFEEAIATAQSETNDGVYVPMGRYVISAPLTLNALEMFGRLAGGWNADTAPLPTLLIRQYNAPGLSLTNGASLLGLAIDYDQETPTTTNAPAISVQDDGTTLSDLRIQNAYDGISTPGPDMPGRARYSHILIIQPAHNGIEISKCYDFVQFLDIEVVCPGAMSTGAAFSFGRVDEGGYVGLMASNCEIGYQFFPDLATNGDGGFFTGGFAGCSALDCATDVWVLEDHKIKISGGDFTANSCGAFVDGTNTEFTMVGGQWQANGSQAVQVVQAANVVLDADMFSRALPVSNTLVQVQDCAMVTVKDCQFLPGSTGLELDDENQQAIVYGNNFEDGQILNYMTANAIVAANLFTASPPFGLQATGGDGQVTISWMTPLGATSYDLKRATVSGGPYLTIAEPTATNYTDSDVTNGTAYYYVVSAIRSGNQSVNSSQVSATPMPPAPAPPLDLTATPGDSQVVLTWTASADAMGYNVEQSLTSGGPYAVIANVSGISYTNTGLTNGVTYYFVVTATNANGTSANSVEASATPQVPLPAVPMGLAAVASNGQIQLTWNAVPGAANYYLKRAASDGGPYAIIAEAPEPAWSDLIVTNNVTYYYVVSAVNAAGQSGNSSQIAVIITPALTLVRSSGGLVLSWPSWASGYNVYAATNLTPPVVWTQVATASQSNNGTFYLNLAATNNAQEFYRLSAP